MLEIYKKIILNLVNIHCNKVGKKSKMSNEHFFDIFIIFLKDFTKWRNLDTYYKSEYKADNYRKKFEYWTRMGIFTRAFDVIKTIVQSEYINKKTIDCIIDSTNIRNINGSYNINYDKHGNHLLERNKLDKFKRGLKITLMITKEGHLLDVHIRSGKSSDVSIIPKIYENLKKMYKSSKRKRVTLTADKGYISKKYKEQFNKSKMNYYTPLKKNSKHIDDITPNYKEHLNDRHLIENYNCHFKKYTRIAQIYDKKISLYTSFVYLAIINMYKI